ncbi:MAG: EamA family transporter [Planctomycetaceae bacterium]|nr:EamA family transporter [Planctomycetaceae bacterium]
MNRSAVAASPPHPHSPLVGRAYIAGAALLWSLGGVFAKAPVFDDWPADSRGILLAFWRALVAGLLLTPLVRRPRWQPALVPMTLAFTGMNITYLSAMSFTTAANAIWLQCTAPVWVFVFSALWGSDRFQRRDLLTLGWAGLGVALILYHELQRSSAAPAGRAQLGVALALTAGVFYAIVVMAMRHLRNEDGAWLVAICHLVAAAVMAPYVIWLQHWPSPWQFVVLAAFGLLQMGLPYWLFARGLRSISGQEASGLGLIEPVLMPIWVYLAWQEEPAWWTIVGGGLILIGLTLRYAPLGARPPETPLPIED